jgi:hypothetical protein
MVCAFLGEVFPISFFLEIIAGTLTFTENCALQMECLKARGPDLVGLGFSRAFSRSVVPPLPGPGIGC